MPVHFLSAEQRAQYGRYHDAPTSMELARYFHLDDTDRQRIMEKRGEHNRLGFAVHLATVRYLGRFLDNMNEAPFVVKEVLANHLGISNIGSLSHYNNQRQRRLHIAEICQIYGYREIQAPLIGFGVSSRNGKYRTLRKSDRFFGQAGL